MTKPSPTIRQKIPPPEPNVGPELAHACAFCGAREVRGIRGAEFATRASNGLQLSIWVCASCAPKHDPRKAPPELDRG